MRRHRRDLAPIASMNLTSLLDITFVLLIAFMIVAPTLKHGLDIALPRIEDGRDLRQKEPVTIAIKARKGPDDLPNINLDGRRVSLRELRDRLRTRHEAQPDVNVIIRCDSREDYEVFAQVLSRVQAAGVDNVGLEMEPE